MTGDQQTNLTSISEVRTLVSQMGFHPSRALGQNFLIDHNILDIIIDSTNLSNEDRVLEVGPGLGVLTEKILEKAKRLISVEKDRRLYEYLSKKMGKIDNFEIIEGDVLKVGIHQLLARGIDKFVSNLPYNPGSRILLDVICDENEPKEIVVTVQLEVAQRINATPENKAFGLMAAWCQLHYETTLVKVISPNCFWPRPDIRSAVVKLRHRQESILDKSLEDHFYKLTRYAFQQRRKQLASSLSKAPADIAIKPDHCRELLVAIEASASSRAEELSIEQWCDLVKLVSD